MGIIPSSYYMYVIMIGYFVWYCDVTIAGVATTCHKVYGTNRCYESCYYFSLLSVAV